MADQASISGIVLKCDRAGVITEVLQDTLGLDSGQLAGRPFADIALSESLKKAFGFVERILEDDAAYNYGFYVNRGGQKLFLHVTGYALNGHLVIIGSDSRTGLGELYHRTLRMHHDQLTALRHELTDLQEAQVGREQEYLTYVERLTTQINRLQESLNAKEAALEAAQAAPPDGDAIEAVRQAEAARHTDALKQLSVELEQLRASQQTLAQSEVALSSIFRSSPAATCIMSRLTGRIVNASESFETTTGYSLDDLVGHGPELFLTRAAQDAVARAVRSLADGMPVQAINVGFRRRDGEMREGVMYLRLAPLESGMSAEDAPGRQAVLGALTDITDPVRVAQALSADLTAAREQNSMLADELRQREYQFKNRLGTWNDPVDVSQIELGLYQQRESELRVELETLRRAEHDLTAQVTTLQDQLARLSGEAEHHKRALAGHAPALRAQAEALEQTLSELHTAEQARAEELAESRQHEFELARQAGLLHVKVAELELSSERYKHMLADQAPLLREHAMLMEQIARQFRFQTVPPVGLAAVVDAPAPAEADAAQPAATAELAHQRSANRTLAEQLSAVHQQAHAQEQSLGSRLTQVREQSSLLEIELGRRVQRQQELAGQVAALKDTERRLRAQIAELHDQLARRDAQYDEQVKHNEALLGQLSAHERAGAETGAQLATLRGELMLRDIEINRLKTSGQNVEAQRSQLHQAMRTLEMRLKRIRHAKEPTGAAADAEPAVTFAADAPAAVVMPVPSAPPESIVLAAIAEAASSGTLPVIAASPSAARAASPAEAQAQMHVMLATEQALREELSAMHQKEQVLRQQIAELDRHVRVLEWQRDDQARMRPAAAANASTATPALHAAADFARLALELTEESGLLGALAAQFSDLMGAAGSCLLLWDPEHQALLPREVSGVYEQTGMQLPFDPAQTDTAQTGLLPEHGLNGLPGTYASLYVPVSESDSAHGAILLTFEAAQAPDTDAVARAESLAQSLARALTLALRHDQQQRALARLHMQLDQMRALNTQLAAGAEPAQQRLAEILRDGVGQNLTLLSSYLDTIAGELPPDSAALVRSRAQSMISLVDEISRSARDVMAELYPPLLDSQGLPTALRWYGMRFAERTGVPTTVRCDDLKTPLSPGVAQTLFRITQEALYNIDRPDPAFPVRIKFSHADAKAQLSITASQSGVPAGAWDRFRIRERVEAIGGQMRIEETEGQMRRVVIEVAHP